jgi:hypothetical protein
MKPHDKKQEDFERMSLTLLAQEFRRNMTQEQKDAQARSLKAFREYWAGKQFKCKDTGEIFTVPDDCREGDFYTVGKGYIDLGRFSCEKNEPFYYRMGGNIEEVK